MHLAQILALTDGRPSAESQCSGLLDALNLRLPVAVKAITNPMLSTKYWVQQLPSMLQVGLSKFGGVGLGDEATLKQIEEFEEGAVLIVACGESTIPTVIEAKLKFPQRVFTVVLGHPFHSYRLFDLVVVPNHEVLGYSLGELPFNALVIQGLVNRATYNFLLQARLKSEESLNELSRPMLLLCVGGPTRQCQYKEMDMIRRIGAICKEAMEKGIIGQTVVVFAQRSPKEVQAYCEEQKWLDKWSGDLLFMLAAADLVAVTADSITTCSEVASAGKPLLTIGEDACRGLLLQFYTLLSARGATKQFTESNLDKYRGGWKYAPLDATVVAAQELADRLSHANPAAPRNWYKS